MQAGHINMVEKNSKEIDMVKEDLKRIEEYADLSFENGRIVGSKVHNITKKTLIFIFLGLASIIASIAFFIYGFIDHKPKKML